MFLTALNKYLKLNMTERLFDNFAVLVIIVSSRTGHKTIEK
jgi:hypothetical protein